MWNSFFSWRSVLCCVSIFYTQGTPCLEILVAINLLFVIFKTMLTSHGCLFCFMTQEQHMFSFATFLSCSFEYYSWFYEGSSIVFTFLYQSVSCLSTAVQYLCSMWRLQCNKGTKAGMYNYKWDIVQDRNTIEKKSNWLINSGVIYSIRSSQTSNNVKVKGCLYHFVWK